MTLLANLPSAKNYEKYNRFGVNIMRKTTNFFTSQRAFCYMASLCDLNCVEDVITRRRIFQSSFQMWVRSPRIHGQLQGNSPSFAILSGFIYLFYFILFIFFCQEGTADEAQRTQRTSAWKAK